MTPVEIHTGDGITLEGLWDSPPEPSVCLVFCHPHPLHRGTMTAPLMVAVAEQLVSAGFAVLRFNFRGVGRSDGEHGHGIAEQSDISAAVDLAMATHPKIPLTIAGWSFGAATALAWQASNQSDLPYVGIAPPVASDRAPALPAPEDLPRAPRGFVIGDHDQFTHVDDLEAYARTIDAGIDVIKGSDHFFYFREDRVASALSDRLMPVAGPPGEQA